MTLHALPSTGERTVPGITVEHYWYQRHVAAYRFAAHRCRGARVVDAGCGEGDGTAMLAETATVTGIDRDGDVLAHARRSHPGVAFVQGDVCALPLPDASVDAVVSLQVVEHVAAPERMVAEAARVLRDGGELLCATPNRLTFSRSAPTSPFHVFELAPDELVELLSPYFRITALLGVHHGRRLRALESLSRRPLPDLLLASPPEGWGPLLRSVVPRVRADDFVLRADRVEASLDLLAVATRRPARDRSTAAAER
ncbi:MAG TPA: class I SAM-dependent methyltransferase [Egibacteraceae bacterium]